MMEEETGGYLSAAYAACFAEWAEPIHLSQAGAYLLERPIPGTTQHDAMGCYPLFCCRHWDALEDDLSRLHGPLVSLTVVTDPLGDYDEALLNRCFPDWCIPFKRHYVVDLTTDYEASYSSSHRRNIRTASKKCEVELCDLDDPAVLDEWVEQYSNLIERHSIERLSAFSRDAFCKMFLTPGLVAYRAIAEEETVGMSLWILQGECSYYHLAATTPRGYKLQVSYPLLVNALADMAAAGARWAALGSGAGLEQRPDDGLAVFKSKWATGEKMCYLGGRIFDRARYEELTRQTGHAGTTYFPAYRAGAVA
jgi:hypothetical protein